jgi:hypothetical protein
MTSPIGEPGRHYAAPDDEIPGEDPIVLDNSRMPPVDDPRDDDLVVLGNDRTSPGDGVPDDEQVVLEGELMRDDDQVAPGDDRVAPEDHIAPDDGQVVRSEDDTAAGMPASGSASAASVSAGAAPAAAVPSAAVPAGAAPAAAVPAGAADGGPGRESPAATDNADSADPARQWPDIQAMFVDDPRASVEQAAGLVDDCVEALVVSVKERQHALLSDWQETGTDTEQLRTALQRYRTFWSSLKDFSRQS